MGWIRLGVGETVQAGLRRLSYATGKTFSKPAWVTIAATMRCNSRCVYCDVWKNPPDALDLKDIKRLLDDLGEWLAPIRLQFSGGEPLLRRDFEEMLAHATHRGFLASVVTNGTHLSPKRARALLDAGVFGVDISLDSVTPAVHDRVRGLPGLWEKATRAVQTMIDLGAAKLTSVQTVITSANLSEIEALVEWVVARNLKGIGFQVLDENFEGPHRDHWHHASPLWIKDIAEVDRVAGRLQQLKAKGAPIITDSRQLNLMARYHEEPERMTDVPCLVGWNNLAVGPTGDLRLCHRMDPIGNVRERHPRELWYSAQAEAARKDIKSCEKGCRILNCTFPQGPLARAKRLLVLKAGRNGR